jgi:tetratricopeptide (TPR) repeat protein
VGILVGREAQLGQIAAAIEDAVAGRGRLVMLAGEPGIGKTSLADAATAAATARGLVVLWGRCWESGGAPAYWPWLDILSALARLVDDQTLASALGDGAAQLGELLPEVAARLPLRASGAAPPAEEARFRFWRAIAALVREAGRAVGVGIGIVLDDVHAADRSSLLLLHFLARELRSLRVLLLCTYRDVEARGIAEVGELIARIGREGTTLALPRLEREAVAAWVRQRAGDVEPAVAARIADETQGNPLFLEEMMRLLAEQGQQAITGGVVPDGVRDVIRQRLDRLSADARALLELAAVAGDASDPPLLVAASGRPASAVASGLAEAARAGVLAESAGKLRFGHAMFREVLVRELGEGQRRALHGRVAEALARSGVAAASDAELAHHALLGPPALLPRAVEHALRAAGRAQDLCAYDDAVDVLERARAALGAAGDPPAPRARVLVALGQARIRRGETVAGQAAAREAAVAARELEDPELAAQAALTYGRVFTFGAVDPVLVGMLEESLEALPPGDSALRARLLARLGAALQPSPKCEEPARVAREAIATARRLGDRPTLLETLHDAISALMDTADPVEQRMLNLEAESLALELGDRERLLRTLGRLAVAHMSLGELEAADARIDAFEALAGELKAPWVGWRAKMMRAVRASMHGRFDEARQLGDEGRRLGDAAGDPIAERIWLSSREGLLRTAHLHDEMRAWEPRVRRTRATFSYASLWQAIGAALTHTRLEDLDSARLYLGLLPEGLLSPVDNLYSMFFVAEPAALVGAPAFAADVYERIRILPDEYVMLGMSYMSWEGPSSRLLGILAASLERWDEAWAHFEAALARCRRLDVRPHLARAEYDYGRARLRRGAPGDVERARALLGSAHAHAEALGMVGLVALAERHHGGLGRTDLVPAPRPTPGAAPRLSLTLEGEYWAIAHDEAHFRLKDSLGLRYLAKLFEQPGREIHVLDLVGGRVGATPHETVDLGDAGELLDDEAKASYRRRLDDLRDALAEAESFGDAERASRSREEMEMLAGELGRAVGLGGRSRRAGAAAERARSAVQRRIKNALERIGDHAPALAAYLAETVRTGNFCVFRPERP